MALALQCVCSAKSHLAVCLLFLPFLHGQYTSIRSLTPKNCLEFFCKHLGHDINIRENVLKHKCYQSPRNEKQVKQLPKVTAHRMVGGKLSKSCSLSRGQPLPFANSTLASFSRWGCPLPSLFPSPRYTEPCGSSFGRQHTSLQTNQMSVLHPTKKSICSFLAVPLPVYLLILKTQLPIRRSLSCSGTWAQRQVYASRLEVESDTVRVEQGTGCSEA